MEPSILSLLPPVVAIGLAIATRRILLSLGIGIVLGALMYSQWNVLEGVSLVAEVAGGLIIDEGAVAEEMYILAFVVMLGILTSLYTYRAGFWPSQNGRSRRSEHASRPSWSRTSWGSSSSSMTLSAVWWAETSAGRSPTSIASHGPSSLTSWTRRPRL